MENSVLRGLALVLLLALLGPGCRGEEKGGAAGASAKASPAPDFYRCRKSDDCVVERQRDCCPCNAGGKQVAVREKALANFRAARAARCAGDLLCPQVYLCDDKARAVCRAGRCEIAPGPARLGGP